MLRRFGDRLLVNPGSVGLPLGSLRGARDPHAAWTEYALLDLGAEAAVAFRRVPVDVNRSAEHSALMADPSWARDLERRIDPWNGR